MRSTQDRILHRASLLVESRLEELQNLRSQRKDAEMVRDNRPDPETEPEEFKQWQEEVEHLFSQPDVDWNEVRELALTAAELKKADAMNRLADIADQFRIDELVG